jgi:hypothetical protein
MKSFKEYLTESKKIYEFKVKIAMDCGKETAQKIKGALGEFHVGSVSAGKSVPIQERHSEFPEHKNISMTVFDVATNYPATNQQIQDKLASVLSLPHNKIKVKNIAEEKEFEINHQHDQRTGKALGGTEQEPSNHQDLVGDKRALSFLQELNREKHQGTEVKGYNDELLAASAPKHVKETSGKQVKVKNNATNIFTKQIKLPKGAL